MRPSRTHGKGKRLDESESDNRHAARPYLWFLSVLSRSDVTYSRNIEQVHFMILVDPIKIKALFINPQRYGRTQAGILSERWKKAETKMLEKHTNAVNFNAIKKF